MRSAVLLADVRVGWRIKLTALAPLEEREEEF
jgi:hypothetical protein